MYSGWPPVSSSVMTFSTSPGWWAIELASVTAASTILLKVDKLESLTELLKRLVKNCLMADCCGLEGLYRLMTAIGSDGGATFSMWGNCGCDLVAGGGSDVVVGGFGSRIECK